MSDHDDLDVYELPSGELVAIVARFYARDYSAYVLRDDEAPVSWLVTWNDGINDWVEGFDQPWHALARLAALVAACEQQVFMVHDGDRNPAELRAFVDEAERFVSRTVHASSCAMGCDGTDPVNHRV